MLVRLRARASRRRRAAAGRRSSPTCGVKSRADGWSRIMLSMLEMGQGVDDRDADAARRGARRRLEQRDAPSGSAPTPLRQPDLRRSADDRRAATARAACGSCCARPAPAARAMLVPAAARTGVWPRAACTTDKGVVIHAGERPPRHLRRAGRQGARRCRCPRRSRSRTRRTFTLLGKDVPRLDIPDKVNGTGGFGMDVKLPGMLVARVVRCPVFGGKVASFDADKAKAVPGVKHVVADQQRRRGGGRRLLGGARTGAQGAAGHLGRRPAGHARQRRHHERSTPSWRSNRASSARKDGDADAALRPRAAQDRRGGLRGARTWRTRCMEPMNCTANVRRIAATSGLPTQSQTATQQAAMAVSGLPRDQGVRAHHLPRRRLRPARRRRLRRRRGRDVEGGRARRSR